MKISTLLKLHAMLHFLEGVYSDGVYPGDLDEHYNLVELADEVAKEIEEMFALEEPDIPTFEEFQVENRAT